MRAANTKQENEILGMLRPAGQEIDDRMNIVVSTDCEQ
jgi:hypothetical protein